MARMTAEHLLKLEWSPSSNTAKNLVIWSLTPICVASAFTFGWLLASGGPPLLQCVIGVIFALLELVKVVKIFDILVLRQAKEGCRLAVVFLVLLSFLSFSGHVTVYSYLTHSARSLATGEVLQYDRMKEEKIVLEADLRAMGPVKSVASAKEELEAKRWYPEWNATSKCTKALDVSAHRKFCEADLKRRLELERAEHAQDLLNKIENLRLRLDQVPTTVVGRDTTQDLIPSFEVFGFDVKGFMIGALLELASFAAWPTRRRAEIILMAQGSARTASQVQTSERTATADLIGRDETATTPNKQSPVLGVGSEPTESLRHVERFLEGSGLRKRTCLTAQALWSNYVRFCHMRGYALLSPREWRQIMAVKGIDLGDTMPGTGAA